MGTISAAFPWTGLVFRVALRDTKANLAGLAPYPVKMPLKLFPAKKLSGPSDRVGLVTTRI